jgi:hypothetical protein
MQGIHLAVFDETQKQEAKLLEKAKKGSWWSEPRYFLTREENESAKTLARKKVLDEMSNGDAERRKQLENQLNQEIAAYYRRSNSTPNPHEFPTNADGTDRMGFIPPGAGGRRRKTRSKYKKVKKTHRRR